MVTLDLDSTHKFPVDVAIETIRDVKVKKHKRFDAWFVVTGGSGDCLYIIVVEVPGSLFVPQKTWIKRAGSQHGKHH